MSHVNGPLSAVALVALALNGCSNDCDEPRGDMFVRSVLALEPGDCVVSPMPERTMLGFGVLDTSFGGGYFAQLLVGNSMSDDVRGASLHTAIVRLQAEGSDATEFNSVGTGFVPPPKGDEPGWGIMSVELLPAGFVGLGQLTALRVTAKVRVLGELAGGIRVESSELTFPITVCDGCLVTFPPEAVDAATGLCVGESDRPPPCIAGQDAPMDCRLCANTNPRCRL